MDASVELQKEIQELKLELDEVYHAVAGLTVELESAHEDLSKVNESLESRVRERTNELQEAMESAKSASKAKSDFLAAMSHEIRTPMNGVVGMIDLLLLSSLNLKQKKMVKTVQDSAQTLLNIIDDILDFSKIEAGKIELEDSPFNLSDLINNVVKMLLPNARKNNVILAEYVDPHIPNQLLGDSHRVRQILFNLIGNAIKFSPETSSGKGRVEVRVKRIEELEGNKILIGFDVIDNGIGLAQESVGGLFSKFTQADSSTTRKFGGTGLGLSICKGLSDLMKGSISVTSCENQGSTFRALLPFNFVNDITFVKHDLSAISVLIAVEDNQLSEDLSDYLSYWNAKISVVNSVAELKEKLLKEPCLYDISILEDPNNETDNESISDVLREDSSLINMRYVLLSKDVKKQKGMMLPNMMVVDNYPLHRAQFIEAVAVCAGIESPEIVLDTTDFSSIVEQSVAPPVDIAEASGELILVAEDNLNNQTVIEMQLNQLGYAVEFANDGVEALNAWKNKKYGMLLTDCHMPNMDGYELVREIRKLEKDIDQPAKIVAITANALKGEMEYCLQQGMDDYISKPVELEKLARLLQKWLPLNKQESEDTDLPGTFSLAEEKSKQEEQLTVEITEIQTLDISKLIEIVGNNKTMHSELLNQLVEIIKESSEEMLEAYQKRDLKALAGLGHKLKSSTRSCGALALGEFCASLEKFGNANDLTQIAEFFPQFDQLIQDLEKAVEQYILDESQ